MRGVARSAGGSEWGGVARRAARRGIWPLLGIGAVGIAVLAGCASGAFVREARQAKPGDGIAFGRVIMVENGRQLSWSSKADTGDGDLWALIVPKGERQAINAKIRDDGSFAWALAPGEYALAGYHWRRYGRRRSDRVWAAFTVPAGGAAVDIGTLKIEFAKNAYSIGVVDSPAGAAAAFKRRVARPGGPVVRAPMKRELTPAKAASLRDICDAAWGIECGGGYSGVRPDVPDVVGGLQPTLKWSPSSRPDVRYDVVVYDTFGYSIAPRDDRMHGPIVAYAEGLARPQFRLPRPLRPKSEYYWAVRLRDGNTVSNWSRYGSGGFYLVRVSSRRNHLYSFRTPAK